MPIFSPFLAARGVVILDGGLASELERRGADLRDPLWSAKLLIESPELIRQVHEDYFLAGADVGTSASYQASYLGFVRRGLSSKEAGELMRLSVRLVREARDRFVGRVSDPSQVRDGSETRPTKPLVAASIGCYGATLADGSEYRGQYDLSVDDLIDWHRPRLETLLEENPDLLACETIPCLAEAEALAKLLAEYPQTPAWVSLCCRDAERLSSGELFRDALPFFEDVGNVVAVGVNCTPPDCVGRLVTAAKATTKKLVLAYPNSGELWDAAKKSWTDEATPLDWGVAGRTWHQAGATLIGGCCRTTPETIRRLRDAFKPRGEVLRTSGIGPRER